MGQQVRIASIACISSSGKTSHKLPPKLGNIISCYLQDQRDFQQDAFPFHPLESFFPRLSEIPRYYALETATY